MANELAVMEQGNGGALAVMPVMDMQVALARRQAIVDFTKQIMVDGTDYGTIPGAGDKPTLFKPGAEKLTTFFGLSPRFVAEEKVTDWTGREHDGEPFFHFQYRCQLFRGDTLVGEGLGSCNSWEKKYRFRTASPTCPDCGQETIKRSKYPPRNNPQGKPGWYCFSKIGGCGSEFAHDASSILDQETGKVLNDNPQDLVNTIDKMAQKRALVAATLIAVNASEFFTQDIEDMDFGGSTVVEGSYTEAPTPKAANGNGGRQAQPQQAPADPVAQARPNARRSGKLFIPAVASATGWTADDVREAAQRLGFDSTGKTPTEREKKFNTLLEFAELTEAGIEGDLVLAVINGVVTREEAEQQMEEIRQATGSGGEEEE